MVVARLITGAIILSTQLDSINAINTIGGFMSTILYGGTIIFATVVAGTARGGTIIAAEQPGAITEGRDAALGSLGALACCCGVE